MASKMNLGNKAGILSFNIDTVRLDPTMVMVAFTKAGFERYASCMPSDASAFLAAIAEMHKKGDNPKQHGSKLPLVKGYRVFFKKVHQGEGKREIVCNVNVQKAD